MAVQRGRNLTQESRDALIFAFDALGGKEGLATWARANPDKFYLFLWPRLLPREVKAVVDVSGSAGAQFNAVNVTDPQTALNVLEQMRDASDAPSGRGGSDNEREVGRVLTTHEIGVSETNGG